MSKDDLIKLEGTITKAYGNEMEISVGNGRTVRGVLSGLLKKRHIKLFRGVQVQVFVNPYDLTKGIIKSFEGYR